LDARERRQRFQRVVVFANVGSAASAAMPRDLGLVGGDARARQAEILRRDLA
jgi:hypothetical protein